MCTNILLTLILFVIGLNRTSDPNDKAKKLKACKLARRQCS